MQGEEAGNLSLAALGKRSQWDDLKAAENCEEVLEGQQSQTLLGSARLSNRGQWPQIVSQRLHLGHCKNFFTRRQVQVRRSNLARLRNLCPWRFSRLS